MEITHVNQPIKVRADFLPGGGVTPLLFKWNGRRTFRITRVNSSWEDSEQQHKSLYFSVNTDRSDDVFQLCFRQEDRTWWLQCVMMEG
ncbi:MAG: hypothetical protein J7M08_00370 [Planctomycetes bacterium]|nr:hypothetical protein [Planctomycetota bacterium]